MVIFTVTTVTTKETNRSTKEEGSKVLVLFFTNIYFEFLFIGSFVNG